MFRDESHDYGCLQDCVDNYLSDGGEDQGERLMADLRQILLEGYQYHFKKARAHSAALGSISAFVEKELSNESND